MNQPYLIIFAVNAMQQCSEITEQDKQTCEEGYINIIRFNVLTGRFQSYYDGQFNDVEKE